MLLLVVAFDIFSLVVVVIIVFLLFLLVLLLFLLFVLYQKQLNFYLLFQTMLTDTPTHCFQILEVNKKPFGNISSSQAISFMTSQTHLSLLVKYNKPGEKRCEYTWGGGGGEEMAGEE